jgi:aryl-alcohol dehydrogenase-like predicted oxidoreductase
VKLGLGTAQFGMAYGISNSLGTPGDDEVAAILALAAENGVEVIDTAAAYGCSEEVLGRNLRPGHSFKVVTKFPPRSMRSDAAAVSFQQTVRGSLQALGQDSVYAVLLHDADELFTDRGEMLFRRLEELREQGISLKIGVSVYRGEQLDRVTESYAVDLVQVPLNVLDQRLIASGRLAALKRAGIEVHARSVFLQGALLMEPEDLPAWFGPYRRHLERFHSLAARLGVTPLQAALGFVTGLDGVDVAVCGVACRAQLEELLQAARPMAGEIFQELALDDERLLNPSLWKA